MARLTLKQNYFFWMLLPAASLGGCSADWYQRDADREVARIVEQRKDKVLGYRPQSEAEVKVAAEPKKSAFEKIPQSVMTGEKVTPLGMPPADWTPEPMGPKVPPPGDDNYDFLPQSYADFGIAATEQGPPAPGSIDLNLDLLGSVEYAVAHSRDYRDKMEDLYLSTLDVTLQRHYFDPTPFASTAVGYNGGQKDADYLSAQTVVNTVGVRQKLPYGGEIVAQQLVDVVRALNNNSQDGETAEYSLSASIPLLKGAGMVNLESLISSERSLVYAVRTFETYRRSFAVNIASQFFSLVSQQQAIRNRRQNYANLKMLSERSLALYAASKLSMLDVQRALQNQLNAENSLIDAVNQYQNSLDNFKILLGMPVEADLDIVPIELQVNVPDLEKSDAIELALKFRLDVQTARDQIEDAQRGVKNARNGLLPDLQLDAKAGVGNSGGEKWYETNSNSGTYSTTLTLNWPLDQLAERNTYRKALITLQQTQRAYGLTRDQVISSVRQDTRAIRVAQTTLEIQKRSVELNRRRLDFANDRLLQGKAQVLDVVDAQSALLNAQDAYDKARANLQTQVLQYLRDTGTLRIDPAAGALGRALDRAMVIEKNMKVFEDMDRNLEKR